LKRDVLKELEHGAADCVARGRDVGLDLDGGVCGVEVDLVHGDALEEGSVVAGGLEAGGFEFLGDVAGGSLVGFRAGVTAFHAVVSEGCGLAPPGCGGGGGGLLRESGASQGEGGGEERQAHGRL